MKPLAEAFVPNPVRDQRVVSAAHMLANRKRADRAAPLVWATSPSSTPTRPSPGPSAPPLDNHPRTW